MQVRVFNYEVKWLLKFSLVADLLVFAEESCVWLEDFIVAIREADNVAGFLEEQASVRYDEFKRMQHRVETEISMSHELRARLFWDC